MVNSKKQGYLVKATVLTMDISVHGQLTHIRKDYLHKVSTETIKNHDVISLEDLAVKNIRKNRCLCQAMGDVSLGAFYTMLE